MDIVRAFGQTVGRFPERRAAVPLGEGEGGSKGGYSYEDLEARTDALAAALNARAGAARSTSLLDNGIAALDVTLAAGKRGAANVPLNTRAAPTDRAFMAGNAGAEVLVFDSANAEGGVELLGRTDIEAALYVDPDDPDADLPAVPGVEIDPYDAALAAADGAGDPAVHGEEVGVFYTSGSTGRPKGVLVDRERMWYASNQAALEAGLQPDDRALVVTPLFHLVTPTAWVFPHLLVGATVYLQGHFDPTAAIQAVETRGLTGVLAVPTQLDALVDAQRDLGADLDTLEHARTGGATLSVETVEAVHEHLTGDLRNTYGLTESVANVTHAYPDAQRDHPGAVGPATYNWDLRVVEATDPADEPDVAAEAGRGGRGEVLVRGPTMADGYLDRPEAEADLFVDGWLRTGDVARVDADGNLHIVDRIDNMIVSGGENIYPQAVEAVLARHPEVRDVAVIGVPHDRWGETVKAVVVGDASEADLDAWCREREDLANYARPRRYAFADYLPRSPIGKIERETVRAQYGE